MLSQTHPAIVTVTPSGPLEVHQVPTSEPIGNEVKIMVRYTASTPLDLHQAAGHLLVTPPQILGDGIAGTIVAIGPDVKRHKIGDHVFGFTWRNAKEKGHQLFCVTPENLVGRLPENKSMQEAVTLPNNFVTIWHVLTFEFGFELPWNAGKPDGHKPPVSETEDSKGRKKWILIWGGSSSCGQYGLQVLKYYGYSNVIAIAGAKHHETLRRYGAKVCFDYRGNDAITARIKEFVQQDGGEIGYILDCIGSLDGSVKPVARIAEAKGCRVAILLPVIVKDAARGVTPEYAMDVVGVADWNPGVVPSGVRTHFWMDNKVLADILQSETMPWALETGVIEPNEQVIVDAPTLLERAQKAMDMLTDKAVSGARLVWRVAEDAQIAEVLARIE